MLKRLSLILSFCITSAIAGDAVDGPIPGPVPAHVLHVVDGDTVRVRAHIWLGQRWKPTSAS